jgi:hypothetical protein
MLSKLKMLVVLMLAGVVYTSSAVAEPTFYKVRPGSIRSGATLILRAQPQARNSKRIGGVPDGTDCLRNLGCQGGMKEADLANLNSHQFARHSRKNPRWCQVEYQGKTGWIQGRFLAESTNAECAPAAAPATTTTPAQ